MLILSIMIDSAAQVSSVLIDLRKSSFGNAAGPAPAVEPLTLMTKGSLFVGRPTLMDYTADHALLLEAARALFAAVESGAVKIEIGQTFPLAETAKAHAALESRATTGSTVLLP